jgi:PTH1 family peptidyl-tRNA hydrolase
MKGGEDYVRIGVGIGRPEGREPDVVAKYVLRKMSAQEKAKIEGSVTRVEVELRRLAMGA